MRNTLFIVLIVIIQSLIGCGSLKQVHTYAAKSIESLNKINEINYTFKAYCQNECELEQLRLGEIKEEYGCSCEKSAENADKAVQKIHVTIVKYLEAIERLSNNERFTNNVSGLTEALNSSSYLTLTTNQVAVANKAGNFLSNASTRYYRKTKLKKYLAESDSVFQDITETFIFLIDKRLRSQLKTGFNLRQINIKQQLDNAKSDEGLKQIFIKQYLNEKAYYQKQNNTIDVYVNVLQSVKNGHHQLYLHRNRLQAKAAIDIINSSIQEVQDIVSTLKS